MKTILSFSKEQAALEIGNNINATTREFLEANKDFEVEFRSVRLSRTQKQLSGIYRLIGLLAKRISESEGQKISQDLAKEHFKYEFEYTRLANHEEAIGEALRLRREQKTIGKNMTRKEFEFLVDKLQLTYFMPKSFSEITKEEAMRILEEVREKYVVARGWHEMVLLPEELRKINEYFDESK